MQLLEWLNIVTLSESGSIVSINTGSIASIVSLLLTIIIFIAIRKIKSYYIFTGRVPELVKSLNKIASEINNCLNDFKGAIHKISMELANAEVTLKTLRNKINNRSLKKSISKLIKQIKGYKTINDGEKKLRDIYIKLRKIIREIKELQKDQKWER